jgi:type 1 fimbriae regulatory protein FimE
LSSEHEHDEALYREIINFVGGKLHNLKPCSPDFIRAEKRGGPMTPKAWHALFGRIGVRAAMPFPVHPHMLRHGCGFKLANDGHDTRALQHYLGHKNIQHTVRYSELAPDRFRNFWR